MCYIIFGLQFDLKTLIYLFYDEYISLFEIIFYSVQLIRNYHIYCRISIKINNTNQQRLCDRLIIYLLYQLYVRFI
jgi:hypothetical protein